MDFKFFLEAIKSFRCLSLTPNELAIREQYSRFFEMFHGFSFAVQKNEPPLPGSQLALLLDFSASVWRRLFPLRLHQSLPKDIPSWLLINT